MAVYCYAGSGNSGHYFGLVKTKNGWYMCNDRSIQLINKVTPAHLALAKCIIYERIQ